MDKTKRGPFYETPCTHFTHAHHHCNTPRRNVWRLISMLLLYARDIVKKTSSAATSRTVAMKLKALRLMNTFNDLVGILNLRIRGGGSEKSWA